MQYEIQPTNGKIFGHAFITWSFIIFERKVSDYFFI